MKTFLRFLAPVSALLLAALFVAPAHAVNEVRRTSAGLQVTTTTSDKVAFHGSTPVVQRAGANQAAITDNTTGASSGTTLAAGVGVNTITIPLTSLVTGLGTSAIDLLTNYTPGYRFKLLAFDFVTTVAGTGSGASQVFNLEIGTTNVTGGALTVNLTSTNTIGKISSGTAITADNVGTASDTLSIEMAASGTVFTAGAGYFVIKIQNMDTADAFAALVRQGNETRASLVEKGLIKGAP